MGEVGHAIYGRVQAILDSGCHPISPVCLHANQAFARRCFCTQVLLHREGPSHRDGLKKEMILQGNASTRRVLVHRDALNISQHRDAFTHRCFRRQILLHRDDFAKRKFQTQARLHRCLYTDMLLHAAVFTH